MGSTQEIVSTKRSLEGLNNLGLLRIIHKSSQMRKEEMRPLGSLSLYNMAGGSLQSRWSESKVQEKAAMPLVT